MRNQTRIFLITALLTALLLVAPNAFSQALHAPKTCDQPELILQNLTPEAQNLWFQYYGESGFEENHWVLEKYEVRTLTHEDLPAYEYSLKTMSPKVIAFSKCGKSLVPWTPRVAPLRSWKIRAGLGYKGYIQNLDPKNQNVMLRFLGPDKSVLGKQVVALSGHLKTVDFKFWGVGVEVEAKAEGRISMILEENKNGAMTFLKELPPAPIKVDIDPTSVYFMLTNDQKSDSFIIKLQDPLLIARARELIKTGSYKLMIGSISYAAQSENRSLLNAETTPFSWRVDQVLNFNDFADISCDASPQNVQEKIFDWLSSKRICFWSYHVTKELSPREVQYGQMSSTP